MRRTRAAANATKRGGASLRAPNPCSYAGTGWRAGGLLDLFPLRDRIERLLHFADLTSQGLDLLVLRRRLFAVLFADCPLGPGAATASRERRPHAHRLAEQLHVAADMLLH